MAPSGTSIENKIFDNTSKNKKKLNIGYFGSLYKSRGVDLILKLSKIDRENNYFIFGNLENYKNLKNKNNNHNLYLSDYLPYKEIQSVQLTDQFARSYKVSLSNKENNSTILFLNST